MNIDMNTIEFTKLSQQWEDHERSTQTSVYRTDDVSKAELVSVDYSHIKVPWAKIHPQWDAVFEATQSKVTLELGPEFKLSKDISLFSFYVFPSLSCELLSAVLIYNMAAFILDDYLDKFPNENDKIILQLRNKCFLGNNVNDKWWRLALKVCGEVMTEATLDQLLDHFIICLNKAVQVSAICTGHSSLSDETFLELRCIDSGAPHQFFLVLIGSGLPFTDALQSNPNYNGLNKHAALHVSLINDLYSLRKEIRDGNYKNNYVYVKMMNNWYTPQQAVEEILCEIYNAERMMRAYVEELKESNDPKMSAYANGMCEVIAGNHYWSTICARYNKDL